MADVKILLVEDESIESMDIKRTMESFGYNVAYVASSGEEAVEKTLEIMPDLILMDIVLKGDSDGIEAVSKIKDLNIPVIYLTAHSEESTIERAKLTEPYGYIIKPYDRTELKYAIELAIYKNKMEKRLKASEKRFKTVADFTYDWEYWIDPDGNYIYVSPSCERITGYNPEKFKKDPELIFKITHPDDREMLEEHIHNELTEKEPISFEYRIISKEGEERWIAHTCQPVYSDEGIFLGRRASNEDITERKQAEEEQQRLNRELQAVSNCNQALLRAVDEQTLLKEICNIICDEAGYHLAWVGYIEHDETKSIRPVAWAGFESDYIANTKLSWSGDTEHGSGPASIAIRTGEIVYVQDFTTDPIMAPWRESALQHGYRSGIALPLKDENAKIFGVLLIYSSKPNSINPDEIKLMEELAGDLAYGITALRTREERKKAENKIIRAKEEWENTFDTVPDLIAILDTNFRVVRTNKAMTNRLGVTPEEAVGLTCYDVVHGLTAPPSYCPYSKLLKDGLEHTVKIHEDRIGGDFIVSVSPLHDKDGKLIGVVHVARDITERRKADEEIKLASLYNRSLIEASLDPLVTIGPDGKITDVNNATEKVTGFSRDELIGTDFSDYFTDPDKARDGYEQVFKEGFVRDYPLEIQHKKGHITPVLYNASLYKNEQSEMVGVFAAARDISDRKKIEDKLKESEERMRITLEVAKIGLWDWDVKNDRWFASNTYYSMLGYKPRADPGNRQEWLDRVHPDDRSMVKGKINNVLVQNFSSYEYEARMLHADGTYRWVLISGFSIERDKDKKAARILGIKMDITKRKKAEEDLKESEKHLKIAMDLSKVVNWEYDAKSDMFTFNDQFYALHKTTAEQEGGYIMSPEDYASKFIPPEESSIVAEAIAEALETDDPNYYKQWEHSIIRADGEKRYIIVRFGIIKDESGQTIKTYGANQDITELKEVEYTLRKSLDEKEVLLREIHHRVKNNLQIIASLLHLQEESEDEKEIVDVLKESEGRVKSMAMVHEKLYQSPTFTDINFKQYIEKLVYDILYTYKIPKRTIKTNLIIEEINLNIDTAVPLGLIVNELVTNSVKHAFPQSEGTITIKLKSLPEQMELTITDNGIGLPNNLHLEKTETLGLKIVNSLVNQIDGKIQLDMTDGTEFKIKFKQLKYKERI